jgi:adenylate kinase family enzyme
MACFCAFFVLYYPAELYKYRIGETEVLNTNAPLALILAGPPACGKSTLVRNLEKFLADRSGKAVSGSMSEWLRNHPCEITRAKVVKIMDAGDLVPDEVINPLVIQKIVTLNREVDFWALDGFARTFEQACVLYDLLTGLSIKVAYVTFKIPPEEAKKRLFESETSGTRPRRSDSAEIDKRIEIAQTNGNTIERFFMAGKQSTVVTILPDMNEVVALDRVLDAVSYPLVVA